MDIAAEYYFNGAIQSGFSGSNLEKVNSILYDMFIGNELKKGFSFKSKYNKSSDLRPNVYEYDKCFIDLLIDSEVNRLLADCIGTDYLLSHIQIRKLEAGLTYLSWHRDCSHYGKQVGDFPPAHKIIYHPYFPGISKKSKLSVAKSSHLKIYKDKISDFLHNVYSPRRENLDYFPSNEKFMFFNGSIFHKVCSDSSPSICLIYSFLRKSQIYLEGERYSSMNVETSKLYLECLHNSI